MKTVAISEETHRELMNLKMDYHTRSSEDIIKNLIIEHRKRKLLSSSKAIRDALEKKGITLEELQQRAKKVRKEIADERFKD